MNQFLEQRIANLMGPEPTYNDPMMMAQGGEVFDLDDPETQAEASMAMESPVTDPNADLREAIDQLMIAQETAEDPLEAAKAQQLMEAAVIGSEAPMGEMAMEMAAAGRGGDNMLAHLTPGEVVLPLGMMDDPDFERAVENRFNQLDLNPEEYVAGLGIASLNPVTGLEEFGFFKKLAKGVKKVVKKVVRPIAKVAQFVPGPWQPAAALISRAGTVYDVAKGRASPLALAGAFAPLPGGAGAAGQAAGAAASRGIGGLTSGLRGLISGGGADGVGNFGRLGDILGGASSAGRGITGLISGGGADGVGNFGRLGDILGGASGSGGGLGGLISGGGADGVGNFGRVGDFFGGLGDAAGITNYGGMTVPGYGGGQITVQEGDTLSQIAEAAGVSLEDLIAANPDIADPNLIYPGQAINIPGMGGQQGGSFFGMRTPDSIRGIEDSIKGMLGMDGDSRSGGFNMGALGAAGLAGLLGKLAYDETKNRKGVPLTPSVVMNAAGRFNLENEIARRSGTQAPNPVEFGMLPPSAIPTMSGGRVPTTAQAELEEQKATGMRYGGPVMAFADGGNVDEKDFKRMNGDINGPGTEVSDDIPAMLSDGEFVMTGRAVRGAGAFNMKNKNGIITLTPKSGEDRDRGTKLMYEMMDLFKEFAEEPEAVA
jgi:LysM repeat protein